MLRRFSVFSLALLLCLSLFPSRAFAWDVIPKGVLYQGDIGESNYGAVVSAYNQFDAACYVLGKDPNTISASIKQKLSDANYGGKFYEYSQYFFTQSGTLEDVPGWVPTYIVMIGELGDLVLSDYQSVWYASTTKALHDAALVDFKRVLYGEDLGGTPEVPPVTDGQYMYFRGNPLYVDHTGANYSFYSSGGVRYTLCTRQTQYTLFPAPLVIRVPFSAVSDLLASYPTDSYKWYIDFSFYNGSVTGCDIKIGNNLNVTYQTVNGVQGINTISGSYYYVNLSKQYFTFDASTSTFTYNQSGHGTTGTWSGTSTSSNIRFLLGTDFVSEPSPPSGTWPEPVTPAAPVAPVLPEPAEPVVETPVTPSVSAPSWPDVTINIDPDPTPGTTPSGLDYTELLTRINDNLISIDSFARAINSNLNSLRSDLLAEFNGVIDSLRNIYNYLLTIDSVLETHCTHLRNKIEQSAVFIANYMRTLIKWLADQLDFDDLTNVESPDNSLLTTINEKLGGGTYEPNPIKDESAYYEWLDDLWDRFLLGDNWQSSMGSISGSFSELKTRFPFSVPWDIVALFRLFVHDPVTPVFDLPLYFSPDGSTPVHVDLSPWDSVASLVRPMVFVIFALKLALLSRDLLGGLGADKGGL